MLRTVTAALLCIAVVAFYFRFLIALVRDWKPRKASQLSRSTQLNIVPYPHLVTESTREQKELHSKRMV